MRGGLHEVIYRSLITVSLLYCGVYGRISCEVIGLMHGWEDAAKFMISAPSLLPFLAGKILYEVKSHT